ncbi:hypothetical protein [Burkholderia pyrrocinia]|uniref:Uncharacterized protein n=1 Tax=Burkholderia pyrrocinia TaxID=60550 RepID=A0ABZ3BC95_BURPY
MTNFDSLLQKSLATVNDGYEQARQDLENIVSEVDTSLKSNLGDEFAFVAIEEDINIKGTIYAISLDTETDNRSAPYIPIVSIRIPSTGYPIETGSISKSTGLFTVDGTVLKDSSDIKTFFSAQLENPNSMLIQAIGFALRKRNHIAPF